MTRITTKALETKVAKINEKLGRPAAPYSMVNGKAVPNEGCIILDHAPIYGGYSLFVMQQNGGYSNFYREGRMTPKETNRFLDGILIGLELK